MACCPCGLLYVVAIRGFVHLQAIYACADCCKTGRNAQGTPCFNADFPEALCCAVPVPVENRISDAQVAALLGASYGQLSGAGQDSRGNPVEVDSRGSLALTYGSTSDSRGRTSPRKVATSSAGLVLAPDSAAAGSAGAETEKPFQTIAIACAGVVGAVALVGAIAFVVIRHHKTMRAEMRVRPQFYLEQEPVVVPLTVSTTQPGAKADKVHPKLGSP